MDEFIQMATAKLGIDAGTAQSAAGALLGMIKKEGDSDAVGQVFAKLPGAASMASAPAPASSGGLFGQMGGMLGGVLGGAGGDLGALAASGLPADKVPGFVKTFVDWLKQKLGPDVVNKLVSSVPALKSLI